MRIAVCDDETMWMEQTRKRLEQIYVSLDLLVETFSSGKQLLERAKNVSFDLVILDIEMPEMDGLQVARSLRGMGLETEIVFLTSHVEYALKGYEVQALRYLTKPVDAEKLAEVIQYLLEKEKKKKKIVIQSEGETVSLSLSKILYLEVQNHDVLFVTENGTWKTRGKMGDYEEDYESYGFVRIHRGYLVNLAYVTRLKEREVYLSDGSRLPLSRTREKAVREALQTYVAEVAL